MSTPNRPFHLWVWFEQRGTWQSAGHGSSEEMEAALAATQTARALIGADPLGLVVAPDMPNGPSANSDGADRDAAVLLADQARGTAVAALAGIDTVEDPEVLAFATSTYAVAAELHAFRLAVVDELRALRREMRR